MGKYLDIAKKMDTRAQEGAATEEQSTVRVPAAPVVSHPPCAWRCSYCGKPAVIEEVCPSRDGQRTLTLWHCKPCQTYGVTPDTIRQPPVWVKKREQ